MGTFVATGKEYQGSATSPAQTQSIWMGGPPPVYENMVAQGTVELPGVLAVETDPNTLTVAGAKHGANPADGSLYSIEVKQTDPSKPNRFDITTASVAGDNLKAFKLVPGMIIWAKGSSLTVTAKNEMLVTAANGLLTVCDLSPGALEACHAFRALGTMSSGTWVLVEYLGIIPIDATP